MKYWFYLRYCRVISREIIDVEVQRLDTEPITVKETVLFALVEVPGLI